VIKTESTIRDLHEMVKTTGEVQFDEARE